MCVRRRVQKEGADGLVVGADSGWKTASRGTLDGRMGPQASVQPAQNGVCEQRPVQRWRLFEPSSEREHRRFKVFGVAHESFGPSDTAASPRDRELIGVMGVMEEQLISNVAERPAGKATTPV
jgi:hypothetical protein